MSISRRDFVRAGTTATLLGALPAKRLYAKSRITSDDAALDDLGMRVQEGTMRTLALRAVDAARSLGATYADVRLTRIVNQSFTHSGQSAVRAGISDQESFGFGVRALVKGYWGFAASPYWEAEEVTHLAQSAVAQAKANALGSVRVVEWDPIPTATGSWVSPGIDPFSISVEEKIDFMNAWRQAVTDTYIPGYGIVPISAAMSFSRIEWFMASTEGTAIFQLYYDTNSVFPIAVSANRWLQSQQHQGSQTGAAGGMFPQRGGWDIILDAKVRDQIPRIAENAIKGFDLAAKPVDVGRYPVVFDAGATAILLGNTIGVATQLDRAIGLEANAGGTSYLGPDPLEFLGTAPTANPAITISANRSMPKGNATVKWDDDGVVPDDFTIIKDGILVDYQTTREQANWLKSWYQKQGRPIRSHGCSQAVSALDIPIQQPPNLVLQPGKDKASFETLVADVKRGYAFLGGWIGTDFQAKNGIGSGRLHEIVNGKVGDIIEGGGFLFNATEIWKNVTAIGDTDSARTSPLNHIKGQPSQFSSYSVSAVPISIKDVSIIDVKRRA